MLEVHFEVKAIYNNTQSVYKISRTARQTGVSGKSIYARFADVNLFMGAETSALRSQHEKASPSANRALNKGRQTRGLPYV